MVRRRHGEDRDGEFDVARCCRRHELGHSNVISRVHDPTLGECHFRFAGRGIDRKLGDEGIEVGEKRLQAFGRVGPLEKVATRLQWDHRSENSSRPRDRCRWSALDRTSLRGVFQQSLGPGYKDRIDFGCFVDPDFERSLAANSENSKAKPEKKTIPPKRRGQIGASTKGFFWGSCWVMLWQDGGIAVTK